MAVFIFYSSYFLSACPKHRQEMLKHIIVITTRDKSIKAMVPVDEAEEYIKNLRNQLFADIEEHVEPYK